MPLDAKFEYLKCLMTYSSRYFSDFWHAACCSKINWGVPYVWLGGKWFSFLRFWLVTKAAKVCAHGNLIILQQCCAITMLQKAASYEMRRCDIANNHKE